MARWLPYGAWRSVIATATTALDTQVSPAIDAIAADRPKASSELVDCYRPTNSSQASASSMRWLGGASLARASRSPRVIVLPDTFTP